MAKLNAATRSNLPSSDFAGPDHNYPDEDKSHAANALSRVSEYGDPALKAKVRAKVRAKVPGIGSGRKKRDLISRGM